jgi:hypothetical protein
MVSEDSPEDRRERRVRDQEEDKGEGGKRRGGKEAIPVTQ